MPETNTKTRRQRLEAREDAIVQGAHAEFVANGFDGAKVADIARRAGVAEGTLYLYFKNKRALLAAVIGAFYARLTETAEQGVMERSETAERLRFLARHHLGSCLHEWAILSLAVPAWSRVTEYRDSEFIELNRTYVGVFDRVIREGISRGDVNGEMTLHVMRDLFYGGLEYSTRSYLVREQDIEDEQAIDRLSGQIMAMILPAFGLAGPARTDRDEQEISQLAERLENAVGRLEQLK